MTLISVWAPNAAAVDVLHGDALVDRTAMTSDAGGWWRVDVPALRPGSDYAFSLDGGDPRPDPRSAWQPAGVHGPSRVVDHSAFRWTDAGWSAPPLRSGVVYELHVGTFTPEGTFDAACAPERLDHLVDLGVTHVEVLPVAAFPGRHGWGYDGVDLFAVHDPYGGPDGFKRFVDACHARGLAVVLDVVYNHLGPSGNYLGEFGPYFTDVFATPWGAAVNYGDRGSDEVRRFVVDNACSWLRDHHVDALRLDAVHAIIDPSATHVLEELAVEVERLEAEVGRSLTLIAESDLNDPRLVRARDAGGYGLHASWSDDFHHALHAVLTGERAGYYSDFGSIAQLAKALTDVYVYDGGHAPHRGRRHGRPPTGLAGWHFLGYLQNHDQVGNRATGERSSHLLSPERLRIGAALVLLSPYVPMLFQGEEWAASTPFQYFTDHDDPELGRAVSEGRRNEFGSFGWSPDDVPDPQDPATFERSKLDWSEASRSPHVDVLEWHRRLIRLRRSTPALTDGRRDAVDVRFSEEDRWLSLRRGGVALAVNLSDRAQSVPLADSTVELPPDGLELRTP